MDEKTALRNVSGFVPGARLRMNIIPPFFNTLLPWCIFIGVNGVLTFRYYKKIRIFLNSVLTFGFFGQVFLNLFFASGIVPPRIERKITFSAILLPPTSMLPVPQVRFEQSHFLPLKKYTKFSLAELDAIPVRRNELMAMRSKKV